MVFSGVVESVATDDVGCAWVDVSVRLRVGERPMTECSARIAIPAAAGDNPWRRKAADWKP
jgi:hypothetical protein